MKKNIIIGVALMIMSLSNLAAQDGIQLSASSLRGFDESFQGARNAQWFSLRKGMSQVQFRYQGNSWIAYFDTDGKLITSGRKIRSIQDLPLMVQSGLVMGKARAEKKLGLFTISHIYEMVKDGITKYYVTMNNSQANAILTINSDGLAIIEKKTVRNVEPFVSKEVIAKQN